MKALILSLPLALLPIDELDQVQRRLETAEDSVHRLAALDAAAGLAGPGVTAARVAQVLALGLSDEDPQVRVRAVQLLKASEARDVALDALVQGARRVGEEQGQRFAAYEDHARNNPYLPDVDEISDGQEMMDSLAAMKDHSDKAIAMLRVIVAHDATVKELQAAFLELKDDRGVAGIAALLAGVGMGVDSDRVVDALLGVGTGAALLHVGDFVVRVETWRDRLEDELKAAKKEKPGKRPKKAKADVWKKREYKRIEQRVARAEKVLQAHEAWTATLIERVARFAQEQDLARPPGDLRPVASWRRWIEAEAENLPATWAGVPAKD